MIAFITTIVPAIIGICVVLAWLDMIIYHPTQPVPELMVNTVTTIIGYYLGKAT